MSEEMNLYKRCKNIFKAHGVDMGGGGSGGEGELDLIVNITAGEDLDPVLIKGDYEAVASKIDSGVMVNGVVASTIEDSGDTSYTVSGFLFGAHLNSSEGEEIRLGFYYASSPLSLAFYPDGSLEVKM